MEYQEQAAVAGDREIILTVAPKRLRFLSLLFPCLILNSSAFPAATINAVTIHGTDAVSERELLGVMVLQPSFQFSQTQLKQDLEEVVSRYHEDGYYFAAVRLDSLAFSGDSSTVDIVLSVEENQRCFVGTVKVEGNRLFTPEEIFKQFDTQPGSVFYPARLERDIENLLQRYEKVGYPFARATIARIDAERDSAEASLAIGLHLEEGMLVRINEVLVEGNKDTKARVVVRETRFQEGEPYNQEKVKAIQGRLNRLNIFSRVAEPELYVNSRGGGLLIRVEEGPTNTFDGVAGYVPGFAGESGFVTGMVNVGMRNLFGTGRRLSVRWHREDRSSQELALRYLEPWLFDFPVNLSGSFFQRQQDTTYVRRMIEFKADLMVTEHLSLGALYGHENVIPSAGVAFLLNSSTVTSGLEVQYDSRDDLHSPTSGIVYRSDYRIGRKRLFGLPDTSSRQRSLTVQRIGLDVEWFIGTFSRQVVMLGFHGRELRSGDAELGDLYRFGGAHTMRGYRENQFSGSRVVWSNAEYRFLLARRSFLFGFFDTGYYFRPDASGSVQGVKYGYGLGIRLETALGNIGVSFALGEGDSFGQGKIHLGLVNEF